LYKKLTPESAATDQGLRNSSNFMITNPQDNGTEVTISLYAFAYYAQAENQIVHARELGDVT